MPGPFGHLRPRDPPAWLLIGTIGLSLEVSLEPKVRRSAGHGPADYSSELIERATRAELGWSPRTIGRHSRDGRECLMAVGECPTDPAIGGGPHVVAVPLLWESAIVGSLPPHASEVGAILI